MSNSGEPHAKSHTFTQGSCESLDPRCMAEPTRSVSLAVSCSGLPHAHSAVLLTNTGGSTEACLEQHYPTFQTPLVVRDATGVDTWWFSVVEYNKEGVFVGVVGQVKVDSSVIVGAGENIKLRTHTFPIMAPQTQHSRHMEEKPINFGRSTLTLQASEVSDSLLTGATPITLPLTALSLSASSSPSSMLPDASAEKKKSVQSYGATIRSADDDGALSPPSPTCLVLWAMLFHSRAKLCVRIPETFVFVNGCFKWRLLNDGKSGSMEIKKIDYEQDCDLESVAKRLESLSSSCSSSPAAPVAVCFTPDRVPLRVHQGSALLSELRHLSDARGFNKAWQYMSAFVEPASTKGECLHATYTYTPAQAQAQAQEGAEDEGTVEITTKQLDSMFITSAVTPTTHPTTTGQEVCKPLVTMHADVDRFGVDIDSMSSTLTWGQFDAPATTTRARKHGVSPYADAEENASVDARSTSEECASVVRQLVVFFLEAWQVSMQSLTCEFVVARGSHALVLHRIVACEYEGQLTLLKSPMQSESKNKSRSRSRLRHTSGSSQLLNALSMASLSQSGRLADKQLRTPSSRKKGQHMSTWSHRTHGTDDAVMVKQRLSSNAREFELRTGQLYLDVQDKTRTIHRLLQDAEANNTFIHILQTQLASREQESKADKQRLSALRAEINTLCAREKALPQPQDKVPALARTGGSNSSSSGELELLRAQTTRLRCELAESQAARRELEARVTSEREAVDSLAELVEHRVQQGLTPPPVHSPAAAVANSNKNKMRSTLLRNAADKIIQSNRFIHSRRKNRNVY